MRPRDKRPLMRNSDTNSATIGGVGQPRMNVVFAMISGDEICCLERYTWFDSRKHGDPLDLWGHKIGNQHRIGHLERARAEFGGSVDVVIIEGHHQRGVRNAVPWAPEDHGGERWKVTDFDAVTGHFRAEVRCGLSEGGG